MDFNKTTQTLLKNPSRKDNRIKDLNEEDLAEIYNQILNKFSILIRYNHEKKKDLQEIEKELE